MTPRSVRLATVLLAALATGSCTSPAPEAPIRTAPTHQDRAEVPAPIGEVRVERLADLPEPRTEVSGALLADRIVVLGGLLADGSVSPRVDAYDVATDTWGSLPDLPVALHHAAAVSHDGRLWVIGGYASRAGTWLPQAATYSLGDGDDRWREEMPLPEGRGALAAASTGDAIWVAGGVGETLSGDVWSLSDGGDWVAHAPLRQPREHLAMAATADAVYVIAGRTGGLASNLAGVEVIDPGDGTIADGPSLHTARGGTGGAVLGAAPCVAGGEAPDGTFDSVECLGPEGWAVVARLTVGRHGLAVIARDGALHVIGGGPEPGSTVSGAHEVLRPAG